MTDDGMGVLFVRIIVFLHNNTVEDPEAEKRENQTWKQDSDSGDPLAVLEQSKVKLAFWIFLKLKSLLYQAVLRMKSNGANNRFAETLLHKGVTQ